MTPIGHAITEIDFAIPEEVLLEAFGPRSKGNRRSITPVNLEYAIREKIITGRVLKSLDLQSQRIIEVPHRDLIWVNRGIDRATIRVSKKALNGATIVTPLSIRYTDIYGAIGDSAQRNTYAQNAVEGRFQSMLQGHLNIPNVQNTDLRLVGPDTIFIENFAMASRISLTCTVTHDPELLDLPKGYWEEFAQLCILATESYIYKSLRINLDKGKLSGGAELGEFKEVVREYSDSEKMYKELLAKFRKYDNLSSAKAKQRATKAQGPSFKY